MKHKVFLLFAGVLIYTAAFSQSGNLNKFEFDLSVGFHSYSSSSLQARNVITWYTEFNMHDVEFSGYGSSILPALKANFFFNNNLGVTLGVVPTESENYVQIQIPDNYYDMKNNYRQQRISPGIVVRTSVNEDKVLLYTTTGFAVTPFNVSQSYTSPEGGMYLSAEGVAAGVFMEGGFKIQIYKFLYLNTEISYSYIPYDFTLENDETTITARYEGVNMGGTTIKAGLSFHFFK